MDGWGMEDGIRMRLWKTCEVEAGMEGNGRRGLM